MSNESTATSGEFRPYRRFVSWFVLVFILLGSAYLLVSVSVSIWRRQHAVPLGSPIGQQASRADADSCFDELEEITESLGKYLDSSQALLGHYDADEVQRWAAAGDYWLGQWKAAGERCGFDRRRAERNWAEMAVIHEELRATETAYTKEIRRFGKELAPRLDDLRKRLTEIGGRLAKN